MRRTSVFDLFGVFQCLGLALVTVGFVFVMIHLALSMLTPGGGLLLGSSGLAIVLLGAAIAATAWFTRRYLRFLHFQSDTAG